MGPTSRFKAILLLPLALMLAGSGCKDRAGSALPSRRAHPTIACLVPAATDLFIGMGAADHLVAISNYDGPREQTKGLPRVGDYQSFDWEQIAAIRPDVLIVFMDPDRMPAALRQRAQQMNIRLANVRTERLEDVFAAIQQLGDLANEKEKAAAAAQDLRRRLDAVRRRTAGYPRVPTLIVREPNADGVVGRDNFINDVLEIAGGENVVKASGWPSIDRETLLSLRPQVVLELLPEASPQVRQQAERVWETLSDVPAVASHRVYVLDQWWAVQPGMHLGDLAERFAELLHPAIQPSTRPAVEVRP